jgi:hypothetical protein
MPQRIVTDAATMRCGANAVARRVWAARPHLRRRRLGYIPRVCALAGFSHLEPRRSKRSMHGVLQRFPSVRRTRNVVRPT